MLYDGNVIGIRDGLDDGRVGRELKRRGHSLAPVPLFAFYYTAATGEMRKPGNPTVTAKVQNRMDGSGQPYIWRSKPTSLPAEADTAGAASLCA